MIIRHLKQKDDSSIERSLRQLKGILLLDNLGIAGNSTLIFSVDKYIFIEINK